MILVTLQAGFTYSFKPKYARSHSWFHIAEKSQSSDKLAKKK